MANQQQGQVNINFTNATKAVADPGNSSGVATHANYSSIEALRTRLAEIDSGLYTPEFLDRMTVNDMVYAVRLADDPATI